MKKIALGLSIFFISLTFHNFFQWACQNFVTKLTLMGLNCSQDQTPYLIHSTPPSFPTVKALETTSPKSMSSLTSPKSMSSLHQATQPRFHDHLTITQQVEMTLLCPALHEQVLHCLTWVIVA